MVECLLLTNTQDLSEAMPHTHRSRIPNLSTVATTSAASWRYASTSGGAEINVCQHHPTTPHLPVHLPQPASPRVSGFRGVVGHAQFRIAVPTHSARMGATDAAASRRRRRRWCCVCILRRSVTGRHAHGHSPASLCSSALYSSAWLASPTMTHFISLLPSRQASTR